MSLSVCLSRIPVAGHRVSLEVSLNGRDFTHSALSFAYFRTPSVPPPPLALCAFGGAEAREEPEEEGEEGGGDGDGCHEAYGGGEGGGGRGGRGGGGSGG
eukprot:76702-Rhodomonas_salina.1